MSTSGEVANALTSSYGKQPDSSDRNGGPPNLVYARSVALRGRAGGGMAELGDDQANALRASQGGGDKAYALTASNGHHGHGSPRGDGEEKNLVIGAGVRRLTPRECNRLQGFPDDWDRWDAAGKEIADSHRYRLMGNAVCVNVAEWLGRRLVAAVQTACSSPPSPSRGAPSARENRHVRRRFTLRIGRNRPRW